MSIAVFNTKNIFNNRNELKNAPIIKSNIPHTSINEMNSIIDDMEVIVTGSSNLYKGIDKSSRNINELKDEFDRFYDTLNIKLREMGNDLVSNTQDNLTHIKGIIGRSSNNIQRYMDHISNKPDDYTYRVESFRYTLNIPVLLSDLIEIRKNIDINRETPIIDRYNIHLNRVSNPNYMDLVRGSIANMYGTTINSGEFRDTLYRSFRNGQNETEAILFTKQDLLNSCNSLLQDESNNVLVEVRKINSEINAILDTIYSVNRSEFVGHLDDDGKAVFYSYMYNKLMELVEVFTIIRVTVMTLVEAYIEAYSSRLDILKNHYNSNGIVVEQPNGLLESINNLFFLYELDRQQNNIMRHISEGAALSQDGRHIIHELQLVHENYATKMKAALGRLMTRIKNLWDKFLEGANRLILSNEKYLKKYKNIIINRPMKERNYEMYDFRRGINILNNAHPPKYDFSRLEESLESEDKFIQTHFRQYMKRDMSFTDSCKLSFRGSDSKKSIPTSELDLNHMYEFCINYKKQVDAIKSERADIEKAGNDALKSLEVRTVGESSVYSTLRRQVLHEAEGDNKPDSATVNKENLNDRPTTGDPDENKAVSNANDNNDNDIKKIMLYMRISQDFLGSKMTVLQEIYKGYMFIMRDHIKDYTGTKGQDNSIPANEEDTKDAEKAKNNFLS